MLRMKLNTITALAVALTISALAKDDQQTFRSPSEAAEALVAAVEKNDQQALRQILGSDSQSILESGDETEDRESRATFLRKYREMHRFVGEPDGTTALYVGAENWPAPIPLVNRGGSWFFDADAGKKEILYRRVGANELEAIEVCHKLVRKTAGGPVNQTSPLHGYYYRMVTGQGKHAGGFAFVAFPAEYKSSGVMTFIVDKHGVVYEKDLGPHTTGIAQTLNEYNPDSTWRRSE